MFLENFTTKFSTNSVTIDTSNKPSVKLNNSEGFKELDAVNHLVGNFLVDLNSDNDAKVFAYATATHHKESAKNGTTRSFFGTYNLKLRKNGNGWRVYYFVFELKFATGNLELV